MINWAELRGEHLENYTGVYLNSPANGIPSLAAEAFVAAEVLKFRENPGNYRTDFISTAIPAIKQQVADLIHAKTSEVALIQNFSIGLNLFVQSLPAKTRILLIEHDYPSLTMPFQINDFEVVWTTFENDHTLDLTNIEEAIKQHKPAYFALSHCQYLTGYLADLESIGAICKQYNCKLIVDATQSFGSVSIHVKKCNISVLGASCYKWALAGFGNGFLYVNEDMLNTYPPKSAGYNSFIWEDSIAVYRPSIRSYEPGHQDHVAFHRLGFALQTIKEIGQDFIYLRITELMDYLIEQLEQAQIPIVGDFYDENRLGILVIESKKGLFHHLTSKDIEVSERGGNIRVGLHYYNNEKDIDVFVKEVSIFFKE
jgi:cysteine desulfurase/selenocysteine lyase